MTWTSPADLTAAVRRRWADQSLLRAFAGGEPFPLIDLPLRGPTAAELGADLRAVQAWAAALESAAHAGRRYELTYREIGGRKVGRNRVPARALVSTFEQAWSLLGVRAEADRVAELLAEAAGEPVVVEWAAREPLKALANESWWSQLLAAYRWLDDHRGQARYLREITARGVDTKFVEQHRGVLADVLGTSRTATGFTTGLGLAAKPEHVRLRADAGVLGLPQAITEVSLRVDEAARLDAPVTCAVIVENEVTFLSLPVPADGVLLWGKGFDVDRVGRLGWLRGADVHYWGDVDTHGFAILDRLRAWLPTARSFLMDRTTLMAHRDRWGTEPSPAAASLPRLNADESALYSDLVSDRLATRLRLEQERIDWAWVEEHLPYGRS